MSSEIVPIQRTNTNANSNDSWFNAFNIAPGQDANIRWLSRPNQQLVQQKYSHDTEKFRITFDVENFQPEQIKIYIQNRQLTISGVYEERSEGRFMQKQFERSFDIPSNADVDSMASYITPNHMLVVEIPLSSASHVDHLSIDTNQNNQRRLSFSLNKYNTANNQGLLSTSNELPSPGQSIRRTSVTKTTTTTTSTGSTGIPPEAAELLRNIETTTTGNSTQTYTTRTTERRSSTTNNQLTNIEPNTSSSSTTTKHTTLTNSDLTNLPIEIPPELLTTGGTITIQKRKVSISKGVDNTPTDATLTQTNNTQSTTTTTTTNQTNEVPINRTNQTNDLTVNQNTTNQTGEVTINRNTDSTLSTTNQQQTQRRSSKSSTSTNSSSVFTLEEFLQNKTWNPSLIDGTNGKKILHMRLQMKPGTKADQMKITLNGYDFRVEVDNKVTTEGGLQATEHSYRQVTLFPTCEIDQLTSELKDDGYLHIKVPINL